MNIRRALACAAVACLLAAPADAADIPAPRETDFTARDFRFHTGETMPELRLHYATLGDPAHEAVLILHGTGGSGTGMLTPAFAGELFGPGQPLDASRYFIILPDGIGAGRSARPSDGMRAQFPAYDYDDMVRAQHLVVTQALGIRHLRLVLGNSMGGMHTWMWGETWPDFMDALVPMASQPTPMASRNWMLRRMLIESIRQDPGYAGGNYATQPVALRTASVFMDIATSGGTLGWQAQAPTHAQADALVDARLAAPPPQDANDVIRQWDASRDYDAMPGLDRITAPLLAINSADDERNPPDTGIEQAALARLHTARLYLIPAGPDTRGHGTTGTARLWAAPLRDFLDGAPHRGT